MDYEASKPYTPVVSSESNRIVFGSVFFYIATLQFSRERMSLKVTFTAKVTIQSLLNSLRTRIENKKFWDISALF